MSKSYALMPMLLIFAFPCLTNASVERAPLDEKSWVVLSYRKIPANSVSFENSKLKVLVRKSAGPVVHKLSEPKKIAGFVVSGQLKGQKKSESTSFDEDSVLRVGLVATGKKTLSWTEKLFVADWVKKLFTLAPENSGLDKIYFYNVSNRAELLGKSRTNPKSEFIVENIVMQFDKEGAFQFSTDLPSPIEIAAIWLSVDGDDTGSEFETVVSSIELKVVR